jgi:(1->4)-alpha-D-glucan 1-alpha-D-glucosylmutase
LLVVRRRLQTDSNGIIINETVISNDCQLVFDLIFGNLLCPFGVIVMSKDIPRATYRLQLNRAFGFDSAGVVADYLKALGVSHVYTSPVLKAVRGSSHGYNIVDHRRVNPELGGEAGYARFCETLRNLNMSHVLDVVPNHMAVGDPENRMWWDVLQNGRHSPYAGCFDIDWDVPDPKLRHKVLLPVLGDYYHRCLEAGELVLRREEAEFVVCYYEHVWPVSGQSLAMILSLAAARDGLETLSRIAGLLNPLPNGTAGIQDRGRMADGLTELSRLLGCDPHVQRAIDDVTEQISADRERMDLFLSRQHYRLSYWRTAGNEINYRRFFDINELVGIRVESEEVFDLTHERVLQWIRQGCLDGLRIDHPDGLRDPLQYLRRLRRAAPDSWIVVEKILESEETLPQNWPVAGTTGYDFLNHVGGLYVDPAGEGPLSELYREFTGESEDYEAVVHRKKHQILDQSFGSQMDRLVDRLVEIRSRRRIGRDCSHRELRQALQELVVSFQVYRTYIRPGTGRVDDHDRHAVQAAVAAARRHCPHLNPGIWRFLQDMLLLRFRGDAEDEFILRLQQLSGPAMAKGVEDTAFYCFNRLISLNEVGGDPTRFGVSSAAFHQFCTHVQSRWPQTMLATSTHDTKRGEDTRLRISLLSEIPQPWTDAVGRWAQMNAPLRTAGRPDAGIEYLLYQTLVGAWPIDLDRLWPAMLKAAREAKVHTSWIEPDPRYEQALKAFVEGVLANREFVEDLELFLAPLIAPARISSLSQTLIKCTAPGIPDFYQGSELWNHTLVDPDNRRPVDFDRRRHLLKDLERADPEQIWTRLSEGLPKMYVICVALRTRQQQPELFGPHAIYRPLHAQGTQAEHVVAFVRGEGLLTVAPRLLIGLAGDWKDTRIELPPGRWSNALTAEKWDQGSQPLSDLLQRFPVGLFLNERMLP